MTIEQKDKLRGLALAFAKENGLPLTGFVTFWEGTAEGWCRSWSEESAFAKNGRLSWRPGVAAVDLRTGFVYVATGGDADAGAEVFSLV